MCILAGIQALDTQPQTLQNIDLKQKLTAQKLELEGKLGKKVSLTNPPSYN